MTKEFKDFVKCIRDAISTGELKVNEELSDFDLAVQFALGKIGEKKGYPCEISPEEIAIKIKEFAPELLGSED